MLENAVKLKTKTETLAQIKEILTANPQGLDLVQEAIADAITKLHNKLFNNESLLLVDETEFQIQPKSEYKQYLYTVTGKNGPYKVTKTYKSWVGLSEGIYSIEGCDHFIPVSWCDKTTSNKLSIFLVICSILQTGALVAILI